MYTERKHLLKFIMLLALCGLLYAAPCNAEDRQIKFSDGGIPVTIEQCVLVGDTLYIYDGLQIYRASLEDGSASPLLAYENYCQEYGSGGNRQIAAWNNRLLLCDWEACSILAVEDEMTEIVHFSPVQSTMKNLEFIQPVCVGDSLYVLVNSGTSYNLYQIDLTSSGRMQTIGNGFVELAPWIDGQLLTLEYTYSNNSVISAMDGQGNKTTLVEVVGVDSYGLSADPEQGVFCFVQGSILHRYSQGVDETVRSIPQSLVRGRGLLVGDQYMTYLSSEGSYLYDIEVDTQTPLVIHGIYSMLSDLDFGTAHPEIGLFRSSSLYMTAQDVFQELLLGSDEVDLYFIRYSSGVKTLIEKGYAAPLPESEVLLADYESLYDVYAECLMWGDSLYVVPAYVDCGSWTAALKSEEPVPAALSEAIDTAVHWADNENNTGQVYLGVSYFYREWTALDWLDAALTQVMLMRDLQEPLSLKDNSALLQVMEEVKTAYKEAGLPLLPDDGEIFDRDNLSVFLGQAGNSYEGVNTNSYFGRSWSDEYPVHAPQIFDQEPIRYPAVMAVYILNPRSKHPQEALAYLEWLVENRTPMQEAMLHTDSEPVLRDSAVESFDDLIYTDEADKEQQVQAILNDPISWQVYGPVLDFYRDEVIPHTVVVADPLLEPKQMTKQPVYPDLLDLCTLYLQDRYSADQCLEAMQRIVDTWWLENQ